MTNPPTNSPTTATPVAVSTHGLNPPTISPAAMGTSRLLSWLIGPTTRLRGLSRRAFSAPNTGAPPPVPHQSRGGSEALSVAGGPDRDGPGSSSGPYSGGAGAGSGSSTAGHGGGPSSGRDPAAVPPGATQPPPSPGSTGSSRSEGSWGPIPLSRSIRSRRPEACPRARPVLR